MLKYFGTDQRIIRGVALAEKFFNDPKALKDITLSRKDFDFATASPEQILHFMSTFWSSYVVNVRTETIRNWLGFQKKTSVLAYTSSTKEMFLITNNLNRSSESIAGTIVHELSHCADRANPRFSWGHGDNSSHKKEFSYPYYLGREAKRWLERNK